MYPNHFENDSILVRKVVVGKFDNNCYWFASKQTGRAILIDAADEAEVLMEAAEGLEPSIVLITHGHWDHIQAVNDLRRKFGLTLGAHHLDAAAVGAGLDFEIRDGETFDLDGLTLRAVHTPGHTPGGLSFLSEPILFSGDTLFPGGPGKTSGTDEFAQIIDSIESKLFCLDDATIVYPGHGLETTIGAERPALDEWISRGW